ncbi:MAG: glycosyltransferase, partial [Acidimicrobiaceae bacterium]
SAFETPASRIGVVRHGIEPSMSTAATPEAERRSRFTLCSGPVLVFPAITHPHKNHEFLLRMMAEGNDAWRDQALRVVFAGSAGSHDEVVRALIRSLGLESRVILPGRVSASDRNGLLKMADAMVFPSQYEGFGAPLIEAMRLGAPVLASNCGSIPEVVANAGIVAPLNVDAWNTGLLRIRSERSELINAGMERTREFTTSLSASDLVREYRATLGGGSV